MLTITTNQYLLRSPIRARRETTESRVASRRRMRSSILAGFILLCYRVFNCQRRWRIGRWWIQLAFRLEGGPMWSTTARRIMRDFHGVDIGDYSYGNCFDPAVVPPGVSIGRYVSIAPNARMIVQNHPLDRFSTHPIFYEQQPGVAETAELPPGHLEVGHDVWIGYNAVVTPGCNRIGTGSIIGAGAVVTKDVPGYSIVAGNPARVIRHRFPSQSQGAITQSRWWELDPDDAKYLSGQNAGLDIANSNESATRSGRRCIASIIIPAHNEEMVVGRCLRNLLDEAIRGELEIIVVANGCKDRTVNIARGFGDAVAVLETPVASKSAAINLGDRTANYFPRFYVDADVEISIQAIRDTCRELSREDILAASPRIAWNLKNSNWLVRAFYLVWRQQPYFDNGRVGSGVYALNERGHRRLGQMPDITADDEYVRNLFEEKERATAYEHEFVVTPPRTLKELIKIKTRSRRGNLQIQGKFEDLHRDSSLRKAQFLLRILVRPQLWLCFPVYLAVVLATSIRASRTVHLSHWNLWERDCSSRQCEG